jgi:transposase
VCLRVENAFRQSKDDDLVSVQPICHWTDSKIRCHILSGIVAISYLQLIEMRLQCAGVSMTADQAMGELQRLHSCLWWSRSAEKPRRAIEEPTETQAQILRAFGYEVVGGVLQPICQ